MNNFKNKYFKVPLLYSGSSGGSLLPPELQACEFLETDGNSWIYLDYKCASNIAIQIEVKDFANAEGAVFGNQADNSYIIFKPADIIAIRGDYDNLGAVSVNVDYNVNFTILYNIIDSGEHKIKVFINNDLTELIGSINLNNTIFDARENLVFFNGYKSGNDNTLGRPMAMGEKICNDIHVFYNDTLEMLHKYYTCYVKTGKTYIDNKNNMCPAGTPGMYDTINNVFYTNDGTGNFTCGPDINI